MPSPLWEWQMTGASLSLPDFAAECYEVSRAEGRVDEFIIVSGTLIKFNPFIKDLLCARHCTRDWRYKDQKIK